MLAVAPEVKERLTTRAMGSAGWPAGVKNVDMKLAVLFAQKYRTPLACVATKATGKGHHCHCSPLLYLKSKNAANIPILLLPLPSVKVEPGNDYRNQS